VKIKKWLATGEIDMPCKTTEDLLESACHLLDHACTPEILGEVLFVGSDGKTYVVTVEAVISEANPGYVKDVLERNEKRDA